MRSLKGFYSSLIGGGMIVMLLSFLGLSTMTNEVLAVPDKFSMLSFSWLPMMTDQMLVGPDKFGIEEIYPVVSNGPIWYINSENPQSDKNFYFRSLNDINLDKEQGVQGEFEMNAETGTEKHGVRIHVDSPIGKWKNVEMSGYFKLLDGQDEFTMIARHGPSYHDNGGCDAYGYYGMLSAQGDAYLKKKTYHNGGGYTDRTAVAEKVVNKLQDRWIGMKFMVYDVGKGHVKLELWVDDGDETNNWKKVTEYVDDGNWETDQSHCGRPKNYIIDSGTRATFRVDDSKFEFKKLSVKEIEAGEIGGTSLISYPIKALSKNE
jgi:hypothetical protein